MSRPAADVTLAQELGRFATDPAGFVEFAFPWGEGDLAPFPSPFPWHEDVFAEIKAGLEQPGHPMVQVARAGGHGVGKSSLIAWLILWSMSTMEGSRGLVTANTEGQSRTKTWPELTKWYNRLICKHWFNLTDTALMRDTRKDEKNWRFDRVTWSENNTDAFQGLHNQGKRVVCLFDEGSMIADKIWEVTENALTDIDTQLLWVVFGNPTRNTGRFFECFNKRRHRWRLGHVDSREVPITNKAEIAKKVQDEGEDSDYVRVRVRGLFPQQASNQLIAQRYIDAAQRREAVATFSDPLVFGVDVARFGNHQSVIWRRRGRDARTLPAMKFRGVDGTQLAGHIAALVKMHRERGEVVDAIFIDNTGGWGGSPIDRLTEMGLAPIPVDFASAATNAMFLNKRMEIWWELAQWLKVGEGAIPAKDDELATDLRVQQYKFGKRDATKMVLIPKDEMVLDGLDSPDSGDALALTFAFPVLTSGMQQMIQAAGLGGSQARIEYDPFASA